ncbi:MAG: hypothetical protein P4N41_04455 [Negativicutes bacterium]|nr:hypothetical protein [Negativicutes bacterium]
MTKLQRFLLVGLLSVISSTSCQASSSDIQSVEISLPRYHFDYKEDVTPPLKSTEKGWLNGFRLSFKDQDRTTGDFWRLRYETTNHATHYDGSTVQINGSNLLVSPAQGTTYNRMTTSELIFGNPMEGSVNEYAYIGIGYRTWDRKLDYQERYSWKYVPVGYRKEYKIDDKWSGAFDLAVNFTFGGKMTAQFSDLDPSLNNPEVNLDNKIGFRLELPYAYKFNSQWSLLLSPWCEYSRIGQSNTVPLTSGGAPTGWGVSEPSSRTIQYGAHVGLTFTF